MDLIVAAHASFARVVVLYLVLLGGWGIVAGLRGKAPSARTSARSSSPRFGPAPRSLGIATSSPARRRSTIHLLYGVALVFALPLAWSYEGRRGRVSLMLGVSALFAAGLRLRG